MPRFLDILFRIRLLPAALVLGACSAASEQWLTAAPRAVERRFDLPAHSVSLDTATAARDTLQVPGDPTAYIVHVLRGGPLEIDTLHDPRRLDFRPDAGLTFDWPAVEKLGYLDGQVSSFEPYLREAWRRIPRSVPLRYVTVDFQCLSEGCGGQVYWADSLDLRWPRSR